MSMKEIYRNLPQEFKKSIADQIKTAAWALGGLNTYFGHVFGSDGAWIMVIAGWCYLQAIAHYLIYKNSKN